MAPEQLFIQRAIEWVKPGGRIGIVLPNGILSNPGPTDEAIRRYILEHCWVLASIELPVETFIVDANVNVLTTLLFLKRKTDQEVRNQRFGGVHRGEAVPGVHGGRREGRLRPPGQRTVQARAPTGTS